MTTWQIIFASALASGLMVGLGVVVLWRHKKAAICDLDLLGATASVETNLEPEGAVMIRGELWPARSRTGNKIERGRSVRVVGAFRYLLEVDPLT